MIRIALFSEFQTEPGWLRPDSPSSASGQILPSMLNRNSGPDRPRLQKLVNYPFKLPPVRQHPWVTGVELSAKGPAHQCNIFQLSILQDDEGRLLSIEGRICPEAELGLSGRSHPGSVWNSENRAILIKNQNRPLFGTQKYSRNPKKIDFTLRNNKLVCYSCF